MDNDIAQIDKFESKINKTINNITQIMDNSDLKIKYDQFKDLHEELDTIFKQTKNAILKPTFQASPFLFNLFSKLQKICIETSECCGDERNKNYHPIFNKTIYIVYSNSQIEYNSIDKEWIKERIKLVENNKNEICKSNPTVNSNFNQFEKLFEQAIINAKILEIFDAYELNRQKLNSCIAILSIIQRTHFNIKERYNTDPIVFYMEHTKNDGGYAYPSSKNLNHFIFYIRSFSLDLSIDSHKTVISESRMLSRLPPIRDLCIEFIDEGDQSLSHFLSHVAPKELENFSFKGSSWGCVEPINIECYSYELEQVCRGVKDCIEFYNCCWGIYTN